MVCPFIHGSISGSVAGSLFARVHPFASNVLAVLRHNSSGPYTREAPIPDTLKNQASSY